MSLVTVCALLLVNAPPASAPDEPRLGRVVGRVTCPDPRAKTADIPIQIWSFSTDPHGPQGPTNRQRLVQTGPRGEFATDIPPGNITVQPRWPAGCRFRARSPEDVELKPGQEARIEILLEPAVRVHGRVVERGAQAPVPGARLTLTQLRFTEVTVTDSLGAYEAYMLPGRFSVDITPPSGFARTRHALPGRVAAVSAGMSDLAMPDAELPRSVRLRGRVLTEDGEPAAGARVSARSANPNRQARYDAVTADDRGEFLLDGLDPDDTILIEAASDAARTQAPIRVAAVSPDIVQLTISAAHTASLTGLVIDSAGMPAAGVGVVVWQKHFDAEGRERGFSTVIFSIGRSSIRTDSDGRYATERELKTGAEYRVSVAADDQVLSAMSDWISLDRADAITVPNIVVTRLRTVTGQVLDRQSRPVAGATVSCSGEAAKRSTALTDADGRFSLAGVPPDGIVFVEAKGHRFTGCFIGDTGDIHLTVASITDPPSRRLCTATAPISDSQRRELLMRLLRPTLDNSSPAHERDRASALRLLATADPQEAARRLAAKPLPNVAMRDSVLRQIIKSTLAANRDEALGHIESLGSAAARASAWLDALTEIPADDKARRREIVANALLHARAVDDPRTRVPLMAKIGGALHSLGEKEPAYDAFDDAQRVVAGLEPQIFGSFSRAALACELAPFNLPAAMKLIEGVTDAQELSQYQTAIAYRIGAANPPESERLLRSGKPQFSTLGRTLRGAHALAAVTPDRARRVIDDLQAPEHLCGQTFGYGLLAYAAADKDTNAARALLSEGYRLLCSRHERGLQYFPIGHDAASVAAAMLPLAEKIDPDSVEEYLWRAVSLHWPGRSIHRTGAEDYRTASLAMLIGRYDADLANQMFAPILRKYRTSAESGRARIGHGIIRTLAMLDPAGAVELVESLPDDATDDHPGKMLARDAVLNVLAKSHEQCWKDIYLDLELWFPGANMQDP